MMLRISNNGLRRLLLLRLFRSAGTPSEVSRVKNNCLHSSFAVFRHVQIGGS